MLTLLWFRHFFTSLTASAFACYENFSDVKFVFLLYLVNNAVEFQFNVLVLLNVNMLGKIITATFGAMTRKQKKMLFQAIEKRSGHVSALHSASDGGEGGGGYSIVGIFQIHRGQKFYLCVKKCPCQPAHSGGSTGK